MHNTQRISIIFAFFVLSLFTLQGVQSSVLKALGTADSYSSILELFDEDADGALNEEEFTDLYKVIFDPHVLEEFPPTEEEEESGHEHSHEHEHEEGEEEELQVRSRLNETDSSLCPLPGDLFHQYDNNTNELLEEQEFAQLTPQLLLMVLEHCEIVEEEVNKCTKLKTGYRWLAGLVTSVIVSLIALVAIVLIPFKKTSVSEFISGPLVAFGIGALIGDALMHLLPEMLGAHDHGHGEEKEEETNEKAYLGPTALGCLAILIFFILEKQITRYSHILHLHFGSKNHHHHDAELQESAPQKSAESSSSSKDEDDIQSPSTTETFKKEASNADLIHDGAHHHHHPSSIGYLSLFTDALHNLTDGFAIGVAFSSSFNAGLGTAIAIVIHEIPQELGDFAILIKTGFSVRRALFFNFLSACACILGTIIGLAIGNISETANAYILGFVAGGFFYIALAGMVPILTKNTDLKSTLTEGAAILFGYFIMFIIAYWVEEINLCKGSEHVH